MPQPLYQILAGSQTILLIVVGEKSPTTPNWKLWKKKDTPYIKFTKSDIAHIYLDKHNYDTWVVIELKSGTVIRSHSFALENLVVKEFKSYIAFGAIKHFWLSDGDGKDYTWHIQYNLIV